MAPEEALTGFALFFLGLKAGACRAPGHYDSKAKTLWIAAVGILLPARQRLGRAARNAANQRVLLAADDTTQRTDPTPGAGDRTVIEIHPVVWGNHYRRDCPRACFLSFADCLSFARTAPATSWP